jgi:hypothetical protein
MSNPFFDPPTGAGMAEPVTAEQAQQAAADQLAAQAAAAPATDAGASVEQMQAEHRDVLLPMETRINDLIAGFQAAQTQQAAQIAALQEQLAAARADAGAPAVEQYANGVATILKAHADANPDVDRARFAPALKAAADLQQAATDAVTSRDPGKLADLADSIERWAAKGVGKHLDLSSLRADLELLGEAAARLAA